MSGRQVFIGKDQGKTGKYVKNRITTARYNFLTFFPLQLFEQFKKAANIYFLFIGALQQIPGLSPTGQFTTIGPLAIFVFLSMVREAYDDIKRHRRDIKENERETDVFDGTVNLIIFLKKKMYIYNQNKNRLGYVRNVKISKLEK